MDDFFLGPRNMGYANPRTRRATMGNGEVAMYERKAEEFIEVLRLSSGTLATRPLLVGSPPQGQLFHNGFSK